MSQTVCVSNNFCQKVEIFLANDQSDAFSSVFRFSCCFFFEGGCNLTFHILLCSKQRRKGRRESRKKGSERGWGPFWTLSKLRRLPRSRVSSVFIKVCQLGYSDNSILCQYTNNSKKKTEGVRAMDRGSWSVTKKKRKKDKRAAEGMLSSQFLPHANTGVFRNDFTGFFFRSDSPRIIWWNRGRVRLTSEMFDVDFFVFFLTRRSCIRERKAAVALASRSISQDWLLYCYWCRYLVRHNWIL